MQRSWALWFIKMHCFLEIIASRYFGIFQLVHYCILISRGNPVSSPDFNFTSSPHGLLQLLLSWFKSYRFCRIICCFILQSHRLCLVKVTTEGGGGGAGRATAPPLFCLGLRLQDKYGSIQVHYKWSNSDLLCLFVLARLFSPPTLKLSLQSMPKAQG